MKIRAEGDEGRRGLHGITENMGFIGFDVLEHCESRACRGKGTPRRGKLQLAGSKDGGWVYTELCWGVQNGNPGSNGAPIITRDSTKTEILHPKKEGY